VRCDGDCRLLFISSLGLKKIVPGKYVTASVKQAKMTSSGQNKKKSVFLTRDNAKTINV
jgi:hypothetical protein